MNDQVASHAQAPEDRLAEVVDRFMCEVHQGAAPDIEAYASRHPDLAEVLRQVLPALQVMSPPSARRKGEKKRRRKECHAPMRRACDYGRSTPPSADSFI
jgi:hypothetical protein